MNNELTHFDLFSGIGGFALAAKWAGFKTLGFSEIDPFCCKVLKKNFPDVCNVGDIKGVINPPHFNLITGGFPCQPWSVAGNRKGINDDRHLWPEFKRLIGISKPDWVVAENVPGIISHLDPILEDLEKESYTWWAFVIPASAIGAPHKRDRLWIVAHSDSIGCNIGQHIGQERYLQSNRQRYIETIQSKWSQFIPESWSTFNAQNWLESIPNTDRLTGDKANETTRAATNGWQTWMEHTREDMAATAAPNWMEIEPTILGVDARLPNIMDRNRALGNAIVPQVIYPILKFIKNTYEQ